MKKPSLKNLTALRKRVEPFSREITLDRSLFAALASAICGQQLSTKAAATIYGRFKALFPYEKPEAHHAQKLSHAQLRGVGLSESKAKAIADLTQKTLDGVVPTDEVAMEMSDSELIERLVQVKGVGKWTVEMILMFRYRRPDVWPVDDLGVQKGFRLLFPELKFKNAKELQVLGDFWIGKRSEIAWYCWRALEEEKEQTLTGFPVEWQKQKLMVWLKGDKLWRLEFTRTKKPKAQWPGVVKINKTKVSHWQKLMEHSLKKGLPPLEMEFQGTPFQQQVWASIASIPWGETRTYLEIAQSIGQEKGVRAVAQACGANPLPIFVPCHRVVATNGLGGFSGGVKLKQKLLAAEKKK